MRSGDLTIGERVALIWAFVAVSFFFGSVFAYGAVFQSFGVGGSYPQDIALLSPAGADNRKIGQGAFNFTTAGTIGALQIPVKKVGEPDSPLIFELYAGGGTPDSGSLVASSTLSSTTIGFGYTTSTFVFNAPYTITSTSTNYWLNFRRTDSATSGSIYFSFPGSATSTMAGSLWTFGGSWNQSASIDIGAFQFLGQVGVVDVVFPKNINLTGDFSAFEISASYGEGEIDVFVDYGTSTGNLNSTSTSFRDSWGISSGGFADSRIFIGKRNELTVGQTYFIRATLAVDGSTVSTSTIYSFIISGDSFIDNFGEYYVPGSPTSTSTDLTITCDPNDSAFTRSFCYLFNTLLVPKQGDFDRFLTLRDDIANKPPFGYLTAISNALEGNLDDSASATVSFVPTGLSTILTPIRNIFSTALNLLFLLTLWIRFKDFKF